jgi:hypothetical protein
MAPVEHPTKCDALDRSRMNAEANDPARVLDNVFVN